MQSSVFLSSLTSSSCLELCNSSDELLHNIVIQKMQIFLQVHQNSGGADVSQQWCSPWASSVSRCFTYQVYHDFIVVNLVTLGYYNPQGFHSIWTLSQAQLCQLYVEVCWNCPSWLKDWKDIPDSCCCGSSSVILACLMLVEKMTASILST